MIKTAAMALLACCTLAQSRAHAESHADGHADADAQEVAAARHHFRELAMGCEVRIEVAGVNEIAASRAARAGFDRIRRLDEALSDYLPSSETARLRLARGESEPVSEDLCNALALALRVSSATDGAFDATCGRISRCWRQTRATGSVPDSAALDDARGHSGWRHLSLAEDPARVRADCDGMRLDFGGIGKGLAASEALEAIRAAGSPSALVAIAGDIACGDPPPNATGWIVRVATGVDGDSGTTLSLANACVSTSGDESQFTLVDGVRHSHIFDPRTGRALTSPAAATVIASNGAIADALATAYCVDPELLLARRDELARAFGPFDARVVREVNAPRTVRVDATPDFARLVAPTSSPVPKPAETVRESQQAPAEAAPASAPAASDSADR